MINSFIPGTIAKNKQIPPILPLFWQHGENAPVLRNEIRQMRGAGIRGFIVESRPHPDFLGTGWWKDITVIIDEAKRNGMQVWFFDDCIYPSGFAAGRIRDKAPQYLKRYLKESHIDAAGPKEGASFIVRAWLGKDDKLVRAIAARRVDVGDSIEPETLVDLTPCIKDGILYWDVPKGYWRVFLFVRTRDGGEEYTRDYLNPLVPGAADAFIRFVHEEFYRRFSGEFGGTIGGFFSDEPRFGNAATYEGSLGRLPMVLPYSDTLLAELKKEWGGDFGKLLPCLWYDAGLLSSRVRYTFMNVVSRMYGKNFTGRIGRWCRRHRVQLIGHVVEDNGAHARLGYGSGHFFRAMDGQDASGFDMVYQVWPQYTSGRLTTPLGDLDNDFYYWGLGKMASSAGHIDPKKKGRTVCELFGANGWNEGLKHMKWLTDHACVRGANILIPHAFSPKFPDPDCPPHFYAQGKNPQWRHFHIWSGYADRVCRLLSGGLHVAPAAVVYHAEAEWAGKCVPFEKIVKVLAKNQIDCDIIPVDAFMSEDLCSCSKGNVSVNGETYRAVIIPHAQYLPEAFLGRLSNIAGAGVPVIFTQDFPEGGCEAPRRFGKYINALKKHPACFVCGQNGLPELLRKHGIHDIKASPSDENLRYYRYRRDGDEIFFFVNENIGRSVNATVKLKTAGKPLAYDAMEDRSYRIPHAAFGKRVSVDIFLHPYQSLFIIFSGKDTLCEEPLETWKEKSFTRKIPLTGPWKVGRATSAQYPHFVKTTAVTGTGNTAVPGALPYFSGTLRYETVFRMNERTKKYRRIMLDIGQAYETAEVFINGKTAGAKICPPYIFDVTRLVRNGANSIAIEVTNTLAKQLGDNGFDRWVPQEPSGLLGPVRILLSGQPRG